MKKLGFNQITVHQNTVNRVKRHVIDWENLKFIDWSELVSRMQKNPINQLGKVRSKMGPQWAKYLNRSFTKEAVHQSK